MSKDVAKAAVQRIARSKRGPAARREYAAKVNEKGGIDTIAEQSPETIARVIAGKVAIVSEPSNLRAHEDGLIPYVAPVIRRLQDAHRSQIAKLEQELSMKQWTAKGLLQNMPAPDAAPIAWELFRDKLAHLAGVNLKEKK